MSFEFSVGWRQQGWLKWIRNLLGIAILAYMPCSVADAQEQRHLRHILVATEPVADRLIEVIEEGRDFKALARRYSLDVGTKILGGDLDWVSYGAMEPEFSRASFAIEKPMGLSKCKTRYGWHVIQLIDTRGEALETPPKPPVRDSTKPQENPVTKVPVTGDRNDDLEWTIRFAKRSVSPGDDVELVIGVRNKSAEALGVLDPVLWPLGLIVRYQFGKLNVPMSLPDGFDSTQLAMRKIGGKEYLESTFRLNDYAPVSVPWPIVRVIWRGDSLFGRIEKHAPELLGQPDYATWKSRWRFYRSDEAQFNVLPEVKPEDRWFLCLFSNGRTWVEVKDVGIPGLRAEIIQQVRDGHLNNVPISLIQGQSIQFGVAPGKSGGVPRSDPTSIIELEPGTFSVLPNGSAEGVKLGQQFSIALGRSPALAARVISCGKVVLEEGEPIDRIQARIAKGLAAEMTLTLAYPFELLPDKVKGACSDAFVEKPVTGGTLPSTTNSKPQFSDNQGKTPPRPVGKPLPRVLLDTTEGPLLVELFEDESPNTVANFISLVGSGFYDGLKFHRKVSSNKNRGFIQGGSPDGTSAGGPGYCITDEMNKKHKAIRGSFIMARKHTEPNTAGSQFIIGLDNLAYLDGTYTVFGQLVEGTEVLDRLLEGSVIRRAVVQSKRDHDYKPAKILTVGEK
ncbi:MAG: peptidylprolyl isomerase [Planctomycetota bacterium]|nr:peptidylprolyl isomerase [Planctomycetota bacterium]